jgi:hypothetical protein
VTIYLESLSLPPTHATPLLPASLHTTAAARSSTAAPPAVYAATTTTTAATTATAAETFSSQSISRC